MRRVLVGIVSIAAACGGSSTRSAATPPARTTKVASSTAADLMGRLSSLPCNITVASGQPGGGAETVGFCESDGHRVQVVTFADDNGKSAWLGLAGQIAHGMTEFSCDVGPAFAACPDPGSEANALAQRIQGIVGGSVTRYAG